MTITNPVYIPETVPYNAGVDEYAFTLEIIGADAFELWYVDGDDNRTRASTDRYVVSFVGNPPIYDGGVVTLTKAAPVGTTTLSLERNTPITQLLDFKNFDAFPMNMVEYTLDKHMMICQELAYRKCEADVGGLEMTQPVSFDSYTPLYAVEVNAMVQKLIDILKAIADSADVCVYPNETETPVVAEAIV